jgi:peptide/nickel transport system substrate-binding protein
VLATQFSPAGSDFYKVNDATLNADFAQEYASSDVSAQNAWAAKAQQRILQQVYAVPVFQLTSVIATSAKVHGVQFGADSRLGQLTGAWISQ